MRILFISASPIQKEISIGNTVLNLFSDMDDVEFASVCTRPGKYDPLISRCFCITEKMLIRNLLGKGTAGEEQTAVNGAAENTQSSVSQFARKKIHWSS